MDNDHFEEDFPISQAIDNVILMHRDAHFGGDFSLMLDYYEQDKKGCFPDIDIRRLRELFELERKMKQNLAGLLLSGSEAERIGQAKDAYKKLRKIYEGKERIPQLIADLILSEEEHPQEEIEAIVQEKSAIVPALIQLIKSEDFYDPLFPGYGKAPTLAAECLGLIGDKRAIISLFEAIGSGDFFDEDIIYKALLAIGEPAKDFLLKVVRSKPINEDNEKAAVALIQFKHYPEVAEYCLNLLQDADVRKDIPLATYLILACEGLENPESRKKFKEMALDQTLPKIFKQDITAVAHSWEK